MDQIKFVENYFFLENNVTSEGAVSHNVLYYEPFPITRTQVRFYDNIYFEHWIIVSTAFNVYFVYLNYFDIKATSRVESGLGVTRV